MIQAHDNSIPSNAFNFFDLKPSAYIAIDLAGEIVYCNDSFTKIFSLDKRTVVHHLLTEFFLQSDGEGVLTFANIQKRLQEADNFELDACIKKSSSNIQSVKLYITKLSKEGKKFISIKVTVNADQAITDKKKLKLMQKAQSLSGDTDHILYAAAQSVYDELQGYFVIIKTKKNNELFFRSGFNIPDELKEQKVELIETSICKPIFSIKKPLILNNLTIDKPQIKDPIIEKYKINSFLGVPFFNHNQEVMGVFALYDFNNRNFGAKDVRVMDMFVSRIAEELHRENTAKVLQETSDNKSEIDNKTSKSRFSPIKDVERYVKKVSGVDMKNIDTQQLSSKKTYAKEGDINKKVDIHPEENNTQKKNNEEKKSESAESVENPMQKEKKPVNLSELIEKMKSTIESDSLLINWKNVKDLSEMPIMNIQNLIKQIEDEAVCVGVIHEKELIYANNAFLKLKECKIDKVYKEMAEKNLLSSPKILEEEKKNLELKEKDILNHYFFKMSSPGGESFVGDISIGRIILNDKKFLEIIVGKINSFSMLMGFAGIPIASIFHSSKGKERVEEADLKEKIYNEIGNKQIYFGKLMDVINNVIQNSGSMDK